MADSTRPLDLDLLLSDTDWLRALARKLVRDPHAAEDLAQDTWVDVLRARVGPRGARRSWLGAIARNRLRRESRRDGIRQQGEHGFAASDVAPSSDEILEQAELQREILDAVTGLDEPYRTTVLLRYFKGLSVEEIGQHMGVPSSTGRTRLKRGLTKLRERLDRDYGRRGSWCALFAHHFSVPGHELVGPSAAPGAALARTATEIMVMGTTTKWVTAGVLVAGAAMLAWRAIDPSVDRGFEATGASESDAAELVAAPRLQPTEIADSAAEASVREVVPSPGVEAVFDRESRATLIIQVRWDDDGSPGAGLGINIFPSSRPNPFLHGQRAVTGPDGRATFQVHAPGRVGAYADLGDSVYMDLEPGEEHLLELTAARWADVRGRVVDHLGNPVPDAAIWVSAQANYSNGSIVAHTRPDGSFQVPIGMHNNIGARKGGHVSSHLRSPSAAKAEVVVLELPLRGFSGRVLGTVRDADGQPVSDTLLHLGTLRGHIVKLEDGGQGNQAPGLRARTDGKGRFEIDSAEPGPSRLYARAEGFAVTKLDVVIEAEEATVVDVVLIRGLTARGTVRDGDGKPLDNVSVRSGDYGQFPSCHTRSAADGSFELPGGSPGGWMVVANQRGIGKDSATLSGEPGAVVEWNPVLGPGLSIHGRVVDSSGAPLEGFSVNAEGDRVNGRPNRLQDRSAADGSFRLTNAKDVRYRLQVSELGSLFPVYSQYGVRPSTDPLTIAIPDEDRPSAHVRGRVVLPEGAQVTLGVIRNGENGGPFVLFDAESGEFEAGPWPPGNYRLALVGQNYPRATLATFELVRGEHRDLGLLLVESPGSLELKAVGANGAGIAEARVLVLDRSGDMQEWGGFEGEQGLSLDLVPGSYLVRVSSRESGAAHTTVEVFSGETTRVQLTLDATTALALEIPLPPEDAGERVLVTVRVVDEEGWTVARQRFTVSEQERTLKIHLAHGSYLIRASTLDGRTAEASVLVTGGESSPPVLLEIR